MSSRNRLLTTEQRAHAPLIHKTLTLANSKKNQFTLAELRSWVINTINKDPFMEVEYFEIVNSDNLTSVESWKDRCPKIACVAVKIGSIRLIDNIFFD